MKVSILMCAYNSSAYIERAIQSVLDQTYQNWELIISDDASPDDTVSFIKPFLTDSRIKLIEQPVNLGYLKNKNSVFLHATGDLITQLDADDISDVTRLEKQVNVFINQPDIKICGSNYNIIDTNDQLVSATEFESDFLIPGLQLEYPFWFPNLMFKKEIIDEFGLFDDYFSGIAGDDHYWVFKVSGKYPIYFLREPLYHYRVYPESFTNTFSLTRKLITEDILKELYRQRMETGTDWLEMGEKDKMLQFEKDLFNNKVIMSEKYRVWAAKAIDAKDWKLSIQLLRKAISLNKNNFKAHQTLFYYLRKRFYMPMSLLLLMLINIPASLYKKIYAHPLYLEVHNVSCRYDFSFDGFIS